MSPPPRMLLVALLGWVRARVTAQQPNLLFIVADQFRFDALRFVQDRLKHYDSAAKIETPHLDQLAREGVAFLQAYCQLPSCAPARTTLFTGCTIERSGVQDNKLAHENVANRMPRLFGDKAKRLVSFEQVLVEKLGYMAERYGKWHIPDYLYERRDGLGPVYEYNDYDFVHDVPILDPEFDQHTAYATWQDWQTSRDHLTRPDFEPGQLNGIGEWPYTPAKLDDRYGQRPDTQWRYKTNAIGWSVLDFTYTQTFHEYLKPSMALARLASESQPFSLVVNFAAPHPPMLASTKYADLYQSRQADLFVPPSSAEEKLKSNEIQEWTAAYYAMVHEVDDSMGDLLDELEFLGLANTTLVVFTADHGEMLGAHGLSGKGELYEEASRAPLIMRFPGVIPEDTVIQTPVSHLDVFSTMLDYMNGTEWDESDGRSLRNRIVGKLWNRQSIEDLVVVERDQRYPVNNKELSGELGSEQNFMVRYGNYKLMIPKLASSPVPDMLFDVESDPFEMNNLLRGKAPDWVIGKAGQLKILLLDWLADKDGPQGYYSSPEWNGGQGRGDIQEINDRRTWSQLDLWQSDTRLGFNEPSLADGVYLRNEYLYVGRTTPGKTSIKAEIVGEDSHLYTLEASSGKARQGEHVRLTITYRSIEARHLAPVNAQIKIGAKGLRTRRIPIVWTEQDR